MDIPDPFRDTIIHTVSSILAHFGQKPGDLDWLREDPKRLIHACEEFIRVFMPLTQIGRVCPADTDVHGVQVKAGERVGLAWAAANFDEEVFESPEDIRLDRKPNPHLSFGFGAHLCLGAPHARLIIRSLLKSLCERVDRVDIRDVRRYVEHEEKFVRPNGYESLHIQLQSRL